jgi:hypothetical protein
MGKQGYTICNKEKGERDGKRSTLFRHGHLTPYLPVPRLFPKYLFQHFSQAFFPPNPNPLLYFIALKQLHAKL